ncbi:MAG: four-helix bundle copper-binding protein [Chloroflexi bacterium]|nr:four-helix bundle copper-binding protein [Chloroflexota bacterium]
MAHHLQQMLATHPSPAANVNQEALLRCIEACFECAQTCTSCADACLGEQNLQMLVRCIRLNLGCADICGTTGRALTRQTEPDWTLLKQQVQACAEACRACGAECEKHAHHHDHCRVCAEACRMCEQACRQLLAA